MRIQFFITLTFILLSLINSSLVALAGGFIGARGFEPNKCYRHLTYLRCPALKGSKSCTLSVFTLSERKIVFALERNEIVDGLLDRELPWSISTFQLRPKKGHAADNSVALLKAHSIKAEDAFVHQKLEADFLALPIGCPIAQDLK